MPTRMSNAHTRACARVCVCVCVWGLCLVSCKFYDTAISN